MEDNTRFKHKAHLVYLGGGFKYVFMFTTIWGRFPIWLDDTVDGQIIQTLDNFIPRAPQISKLSSSSKGLDGWTKQIKPHSMTRHAHVV